MALNDLSQDTSVLDVFLHLRGDCPNTDLEKILNTPNKQKQAKAAYLQLYEILLASRRDRRPTSDRLAWILPERMLGARSVIQEQAFPEVEMCLREALGTRWHWISDSFPLWLPLVSLGSANLIRRWRAPRINTIRRAMFRLAKSFDGSTNAFLPWEQGYHRLAGRTPIQALYQFEPTRLVDGAILEFTNLEFVLVNDLRCLHPDAVRLINDKKGRNALFSLYRKLKDAPQ